MVCPFPWTVVHTSTPRAEEATVPWAPPGRIRRRTKKKVKSKRKFSDSILQTHHHVTYCNRILQVWVAWKKL